MSVETFIGPNCNLILVSPDGTMFRITVDNSGVISTTNLGPMPEGYEDCPT